MNIFNNTISFGCRKFQNLIYAILGMFFDFMFLLKCFSLKRVLFIMRNHFLATTIFVAVIFVPCLVQSNFVLGGQIVGKSIDSNPVFIESIFQEVAKVISKSMFSGIKCQIFSHKSFSAIPCGFINVLKPNSFLGCNVAKEITNIDTHKCACNANKSHNDIFHDSLFKSLIIGYIIGIFIAIAIGFILYITLR